MSSVESTHLTTTIISLVLTLTEISRRFIPNREGQDLQASFSLLHEDGSPAVTPSKVKKRTPQGELHFQKSAFRHSSRDVLRYFSKDSH